MTPSTPPARRAALPALLALAAATIVGCTADRHTFRSTAAAPKSVAVSYVATGETAWSYDIPVGQQLTLEFTRAGQFNGFKAPDRPAESMAWYTTSADKGRDFSGQPGKGDALESGVVELSGLPIQMNVSKRPVEADLPAVTAPPVPAPPATPAMEEPAEPQPAMDTPEPAMEQPIDQADDAMQDAVEQAQDAAEDMSK